MKAHSLTRRVVLMSTALLAVPSRLFAATPSPPGATEYIISPRGGQKVKSPFRVQFGLKGMGVTHAGDEFKNSGHHHLLIDVTEKLDPDSAIPMDKQHMHFGAGQTETILDLPKGVHTLQLVLGDANHVPFSPSVQSRKIRITVV
jgi:Domain of unknown function (DUF4399)